MPTVTNFGDVLTTGNTVLQGNLSVLNQSTFLTGNLLPNVAGSSNIGQLSAQFGSAYIQLINAASMNVTTQNATTVNVSSNLLTGGFSSNTTNTSVTGTLNFNNLLVGGTVGTTNQTIITTGSGAGVQWGTIIGSQWTTGTSNIYYVNPVGIGTSSVNSNLTVVGNAYVSANVNTNGFLIGGVAGTSGQAIVATGTGAGIQWGSASQWTTSGLNIYYLSNVGIGTTTVTYPLTVIGFAASKAAPYSNLAYQSGGWYQAYQASSATSLKIYTDGNIGCAEVDVFSDRRIKKDVKDFDPAESLDLVKRLRVREFKYVDPIEYGTKAYKGLIAQEVRDVVDEAVALHKGVVPTIFQVPKSFEGRSVQFENKIEGVSIGDIIKVLDEESERLLIAVRVGDYELEFSEPLVGPKVFVYGQVIEDLHTVSYDRLVPLLIGAVQALAGAK
jgi:hypothetical protein